MRWGTERLRRAIQTGEARNDVDKAAALGALYAPLSARLCFGLPALDEDQVAADVDIVLRGIFNRT